MGNQCCDKCRVVIPQGADKVLNFQLKDCLTGVPFNIAAATPLVVVLPADNDAGFLSYGLTSGVSILNGPAGLFQCIIPRADTPLLPPGPIDIKAEITIAGLKTIVWFRNAADVQKDELPGS